MQINGKHLSGYTLICLFTALLTFLGLSLYGLIQVVGAWAWLIVCLSIEYKVNGKRFSVFSPAINRLYTRVIVWVGFCCALWTMIQ
jgi:hypothetical protein